MPAAKVTKKNEAEYSCNCNKRDSERIEHTSAIRCYHKRGQSKVSFANCRKYHECPYTTAFDKSKGSKITIACFRCHLIYSNRTKLRFINPWDRIPAVAVALQEHGDNYPFLMRDMPICADCAANAIEGWLLPHLRDMKNCQSLIRFVLLTLYSPQSGICTNSDI
jgi:hypothetical protein